MTVGDPIEVCLYASDLDAAKRFYSDVLGLDVLSHELGRHVFFRCGRAVFLVFNPDATMRPGVGGKGPAIPPHGATGAGHVAFSVTEAEIPAWRQRLKAKQVAVEAEVSWPGGGSSIYFRDPAGNSVELTTPETWGL